MENVSSSAAASPRDAAIRLFGWRSTVSMTWILPWAYFIWHILVPSVIKIIPSFKVLDYAFNSIMLAAGLAVLICGKRHFLNKNITALLVIITIPFLLSALWNRPSLSLGVMYYLSTIRPLILIFYLYVFNTDIEGLYKALVTTSFLLVAYNIPGVIFNLIRYNVSIFHGGMNDVITGVPPFSNNDSLVPLYLILFFHCFYKLLTPHAKKTKTFLWLFSLAFLLCTTVNLKYIVLTAFSAIILLQNKSLRIKAAFAGGCIFFCIVLSDIFGVFQHYWDNLDTIPIFKVMGSVVSENIDGYNLWVGAGPGMFTSSIAIKAGTPMAVKHILPFKDFYETIWHTTGTFTRSESALSSLLGDVGLIGVILYLSFLIWLTITNYKNRSKHPLFMLGFACGINALVLGIFIDSWFWGLDIYFCALAFALYLLAQKDPCPINNTGEIKSAD